MSSGSHVQPKFSCGHPNLTAQLKQKEAEQELLPRPKTAPIKGSCQATGNVKQCPASSLGLLSVSLIRTLRAPIVPNSWNYSCYLFISQTLSTRAGCK